MRKSLADLTAGDVAHSACVDKKADHGAEYVLSSIHDSGVRLKTFQR